MFLRIGSHDSSERLSCDNPSLSTLGLLKPTFRVHLHQCESQHLQSLIEIVKVKGNSKGDPYFDVDMDVFKELSENSPLWLERIENAVSNQYGPIKTYSWRHREFSSRPSVMGILNITPDSFSDGGQFFNHGDALARAEKMIEEGVDIIDVGGESTRPFSDAVTAQEEMQRILLVIKEIRSITEKPISVDTMKPLVARKALDAGASMINDVSGLRHPDMIKLAAEADVPVVIMHMRGLPQDMQTNIRFNDVVREIVDELNFSILRAEDGGVKSKNIILDPGIGFGKNIRDNLEIFKRLREFKCLGFPILVGASRKSFISKTLDVDDSQRLEGSLALSSISMNNGSDILRVHDVRETLLTLRMAEAVQTLTV